MKPVYLRFLMLLLVAGFMSSTTHVFAQSADDLLGDIPDEPSDEPKDRATKKAIKLSDEPAGNTKVLKAEDAAAPVEKKQKKPKKKRERLQSRKDLIKSVQRRPVVKKHRLELHGAGALSINDPLYLVMGIQGGAHFYIAESLSIGVGATYFMTTAELSGIDDIRRSEQSVPSVFERPHLAADLEFTFTPFYGKFSFLQSPIIHFDFYIIGGMGVAANLHKTGRPMGVVGVGQRIYLSKWLDIKIEIRDYIFNDTLLSEYGSHSDIQNYMMLTVGAGFFIPPTFKYKIRK